MAIALSQYVPYGGGHDHRSGLRLTMSSPSGGLYPRLTNYVLPSRNDGDTRGRRLPPRTFCSEARKYPWCVARAQRIHIERASFLTRHARRPHWHARQRQTPDGEMLGEHPLDVLRRYQAFHHVALNERRVAARQIGRDAVFLFDRGKIICVDLTHSDAVGLKILGTSV